MRSNNARHEMFSHEMCRIIHNQLKKNNKRYYYNDILVSYVTQKEKKIKRKLKKKNKQKQQRNYIKKIS